MAAAVQSSTSLDDDRTSRTSRYERPYCSPRLARSRSRPRPETVNAPTREFAAAVADVASQRKSRMVAMGMSPVSPGGRERDALEFVVDVPVWSLGSFSDLSTMHALRDTTLAHVHTLIGHLADAHALTATYRILARRPGGYAWGSIRLASSLLDGANARPSRRTSFVKAERSVSPRSPSFDCAFASDEDVAEEPQQKPLKPTQATPTLVAGYQADPEEDDDDEADTDALVRAQVEARGLVEGSAFVLSVKEQLTLVLV
ncbi:uncharacterized protein CcaverHIS019_0602630 [Cutaneotrichosporon cavernicola]|uniref:Uncharacterized protein n=1 Tax=Cutaneotrichosporon cavernicola TaxID=279322 RepID=A0AA48L8B4_9TREE|nr:uncharacterized protein CcaverHIS019_0602630 [Cutaneotrichosporon cavernicola]BEI93804.1 hypothetical protein CcaverHIS019_0602630 [Cutaneotrichosporon cavernicola]BEJ01581.1 hypothetical protein CcaverHIS631_0602630 [Cutaneotrichosporon cavernicola]BEJ09347.1 hypothetical protein CcaverHIS641_0602620 [Cutaneotrichosporon cavernicola]